MPDPFGECDAAGVRSVYEGLAQAWPDMERRTYISISGDDEHGGTWVGEGGFYTGTFEAPWLGIPATRRVAHMRFHEFFRVEAGRITEIQFAWDIPEVMMQANAWPLAPSLGREWCVPGPATCDGLGPHDAARSDASRQHIVDMLMCMKKHPAQGGPELMELERFWHPKMAWYGPSGIGTGRGTAGFRRVHQIPFLKAMPDRGYAAGDIRYHFFAEGDYVGVTGWPNMLQTLTHPGWMGIAPPGKHVEMRSLDFWRLEDGLIRENWVLVDLIHLYSQIGVDVFERMREYVNGGAPL
ncbi:MAG: ester cyclase [Pseudomonadota bacterium]